MATAEPFARKQKRADILATLAMGAVFLTCCAAWRLPRQDAEEALPENPRSIAELHRDIGWVDPKAARDGALEIGLDLRAPLYEASVVTDLAKDALFISKGLQTFFPDVGNTSVRFVARLPVKGHERFATSERVLELTFPKADLASMDPEGSSSFQDLLELMPSVGYVAPASKRLVRAFCDDPLAKSAQAFCRREPG